ncbi:anti-sigma factor [Streptomyces sp. 1-11]|uniref:anti-sigma factor family protein n=1 Tax=Streptomyces sp. 1-11 TaxID=2590549 RepID=UPI00116CAF89|nr:zf-HC2 domain-containing protein [Streptomyces sp. 1-11]GEK04520.1 hypothetical protein TNCT1_67960 [Streptomyces sp. 1-11]
MTPTGSDAPWSEDDGDDHFGIRLSELVAGQLGADTRERVLAHLASCEKCKAEAEAQRRFRVPFEWVRPWREIASNGHHIVDPPARLVRIPRREPRAERWTSLAAKIAGDRRDMRTAWLADLAGRPEDGVFLTAWQQRWHALGFLVAAVRFFLRDTLGHLWRPVDWILTTRNRRESFVGLPPALLVLYIARHDGVHTLLTEGWGWVGGCGAAMFALVRWLQRIRGIDLAEGTGPDAE